MSTRCRKLRIAAILAFSQATVGIAAPASAEGNQGAESATSPRRDAADARTPTDDELEVLCRGAYTSVSPIPSGELEEELDTLRDQLQTALQTTASLAPGHDAACRNQADSIEGFFGQHETTARSLCDSRQPNTISGDQLVSDAAELLQGLHAEIANAAQANWGSCKASLTKFSREFQVWDNQVRGACTTVCSNRSGSTDIRDAAVRVCAARRDHKIVQWTDVEVVARCLQQHSLAGVVQSERAQLRETAPHARAPGSERALGGDSLQTTVLNGAAEFFVDRAQREMSLFAAEVVAQQLCNNLSSARGWLPQTCSLLYPIDGDQPVLAVSPLAIHEAARADLEALPGLLVEKLESEPTLRCTLAIASGFSAEAKHGAELAPLLADLEPILSQALVKEACKASPKILKRVRDVSDAVDKARSAGASNLPSLLRSRNFDYLISLGDRRLVSGESLSEVGEATKEVLRRVQELDAVVSRLPSDPTQAGISATVVAGLRTIQPVLRYAVSETESEPHIADVDTLIDVVTRTSNGEYARALTSGARLATVRDLDNPNTRSLLILGAALAQAQSSDAVRATFEDAALPLQSWRRKNQPRWGMTLTGMVGLHPAYEVVLQKLDNSRVSSGLSFAPTLMVGADVHRGFGSSRVGLMFSFLDLGALGTIRLDTPEVRASGTGTASSVSGEPEVRIEQVVAPGLYAYLGAGPINLALGSSFVPSLRPTTNAAGTSSPLSVVRLGAFIAVDVSVLPLL